MIVESWMNISDSKERLTFEMTARVYRSLWVGKMKISLKLDRKAEEQINIRIKRMVDPQDGKERGGDEKSLTEIRIPQMPFAHQLSSAEDGKFCGRMANTRERKLGKAVRFLPFPLRRSQRRSSIN